MCPQTWSGSTSSRSSPGTPRVVGDWGSRASPATWLTMARSRWTSGLISQGAADQGQRLGIEGNDALHGLSGLSAMSGGLDIVQNALLSDISGLSGLTSVAGDLTIYRNPSQSTADAEALAYDTIGEANIGGAVTIEYNAE